MSEKENQNPDPRNFVTKSGIISYPHLFKPMPYKNSAPKFSATLLIPKEDKNGNPTDMSAVKNAIKKTKIDTWGADPKKWPADLILLIKDGDSEECQDNPECAGHWVLKTSSTEENPPQVIDREGDAITNPGDVYPGAICRLQLYAFPYGELDLKKRGERGITFVLKAVQKIKDGKALGNRKSAKEVFGAHEIEDDFPDMDESGDDQNFGADESDDIGF